MEKLKIQNDLKKFARKDKAIFLPRFFKCGKNEYGEGDIFIGVMVPDIRTVAKNNIDLIFTDLKILINSKIHEERLLSLFILVLKYQKSKILTDKKKCIDFYLKNLKGVNNWDLVDLSCYKLLGNWLLDKPRDLLYEFANSDNLWKKRISIVSTYEFIRNGEFDDTIKIAKILLKDNHDLIHKAVGWMLREMGKRDILVLENFLKDENYKKMPRTMLRYAIEKMADDKRRGYLIR